MASGFDSDFKFEVGNGHSNSRSGNSNSNSHGSSDGNGGSARRAGTADAGGGARRAGTADAGSGAATATATTAATTAKPKLGSLPRRESMGVVNIRRAQLPPAISPATSTTALATSQGYARGGMDFAAPPRPRPATARPSTARSRLSHGMGGSSFKESSFQSPSMATATNAIGGFGASPYMHSGAANDSRISLLSMVGGGGGEREDADEFAEDEHARMVKNTRSSRALSNGGHQQQQQVGRPRSRTQSSEVSTRDEITTHNPQLAGLPAQQGIVTVFSGVQLPPRLDADLDALNKLARFRPLVLAPSNNRLSGLFHSGPRYIEPTAEQLNLDETELTGLCFSFREHIAVRVAAVCERQTAGIGAARRVGMRAADTQTRAAQALQAARQAQEGAA
ncbi:hypothetical protein LPJ66_008606, partial [Kickxella alabastrina]